MQNADRKVIVFGTNITPHRLVWFYQFSLPNEQAVVIAFADRTVSSVDFSLQYK